MAQTGRPREDPRGSKLQYSVYLTPAQVDLLETRYGSVREGLKAWLATLDATAPKDERKRS
jgi:hypothetical protein